LFVFSKLFWIVAQPGNLLLLLLLWGVLRLAVTGRRRGFGAVVAATLAFLVVCILPVGLWAVGPLERRFAPPDPMPASVDGIIVLGGAVDPDISASHGQVSLNDAGERITEAVALALRYPSARILLSGGSGALTSAGRSEADAMSLLMVADGISADRLMLEGKSRNTIENAEYSLALARPKPGETWLLVTSAAHMPRSVGCFRHVGWSIVPYPVDYHLGGEVTPDTFELGQKLTRLDYAMREWVGLVAYRLLGRIDTWFPAPAASASSATSAR
jgi:uncharacterized SAM-binding protein YcdF (DUF218 family)